MESIRNFETDEVFLTLSNFSDNVFGCEDSWSEFDNLYILELVFFSDELEQDISGSVYFGAHLPNHPPKQPRIQNQQPNRTEA